MLAFPQNEEPTKIFKKELKKRPFLFFKLNVTGINDLLSGTLKVSLPLTLDTREKLLLL